MEQAILTHFRIPGTFIKAEKYGSGLIHDTWLCEFTDGDGRRKYILQRMNASVFKRPEQVMENIQVVTTHITDKLRAHGQRDPEHTTLTLVPAWSGHPYFLDSTAQYWRVFHFIESCAVYNVIADPALALEIGHGLGRFHALVSDLAPRRLNETLPGFHHPERYFKSFEEAVKEDTKKRTAEVHPEIDFVKKRRQLVYALMSHADTGGVPQRVVHNDPKVNNVLIHIITGKAVCMIDLDTVMPGLSAVDFGDGVRSACNPAGEETNDFSSVKLDMRLFESFAKGYLSEANVFLTDKEIGMLPASVKVITFELGIRFLADYLQGDTYFRVRYPDHNLNRARVQFLLLESIEKSEERMASIVKRYA